WALDERLRRIVAAGEAKAIGRGGISSVSRSTGVSRRAIHAGFKELQDHPQDPTPRRIRRPGAGRKKISEADPSLMSDLESLVEP
ncbi:ISAzo13 family transposase, partial [Ferrimicrobium acidiphilum]